MFLCFWKGGVTVSGFPTSNKWEQLLYVYVVDQELGICRLVTFRITLFISTVGHIFQRYLHTTIILTISIFNIAGAIYTLMYNRRNVYSISYVSFFTS